MIEKLRDEVDWDSDDASARAAEVLKTSLSEYVARYSREGDGALMTYRDTDQRVSLADEYSQLTQSLDLIDFIDKRFGDDFRAFPETEGESVENLFSWSVVKIGFKPVLMFTHTMSKNEAGQGIPAFLSVSKQIFANHYFDSSLGITLLLSPGSDDEAPETYLLFINRSRASALRGRLGRLLRGLIEDQAKGKLEEFLADAKRYTALEAANRASARELEALEESEAENNWLGSWRLWAGVVGLLVVLATGW